MKKNLSLTLVVLLLFALAACGGSVDPEAIVNEVSNAAGEVVDSVSEEISGTTEEAVPTEEPAAEEAASEEESGEAEAVASEPEPAIVDLTGAPAAIIENTDGYYRLQTMFLEAENFCLEGNRLSEDSVLNGEAFMDDCQDVTGQLWKIVPTDDAGYYRLQTMFLESENKCLEGNRRADESVLGGGSFMDDCQNVTGQSFKFVDAGNGYYRIQTMFLEAENKCWEGNRLADASVLSGGAFMDDCQDVTGQLWKLVPVDIPQIGALQGQVVDLDSGEPLAEVKVCVQGSEQCANTDAAGTYTLSNVSAPEQTLEVSLPGYITAVELVAITANETLTQDFALTAEVVEEPEHPVFAELPDDAVLRGAVVVVEHPATRSITDQEMEIEVQALVQFFNGVWPQAYPDYNINYGDSTLVVRIDGTTHVLAVLVPNLSETELGKAANDAMLNRRLYVTAVGESNQLVKTDDLMEIILTDPNSSSAPYTVNFYRGEARDLIATFTINNQ